jgi:cytochrome c peroxidase
MAEGPVTTLSAPDESNNYAAIDLPRHFQTKLVRSFDNTPADNPITDAGAALGRYLFYDTRLSADGRLACASCHIQRHAFADPARFSKGVGGVLGDRNAMSLVNARYYSNGRFFWDERARTLEEQVLEPIANPKEMATNCAEVVDRLRNDTTYAKLCRRAFGDRNLTVDRLAKALAQFVRSLVSYRSKFDEGMASAKSILDDFPNFDRAENEGKAIFLGAHDARSRGNCATCHLRRFAFWERSDQAKQQAIFTPDRALNNGLEIEFVNADNGVGDISLDPRDYGRFKAPDLRNVELTAPYMHDGRFTTLEDVVEHYNSRVQPHPNLDPQLRNGGRPPEARLMRLDALQKAALVAFLKTLTDRAFVSDPKFSNPFEARERQGASGGSSDPN